MWNVAFTTESVAQTVSSTVVDSCCKFKLRHVACHIQYYLYPSGSKIDFRLFLVRWRMKIKSCLPFVKNFGICLILTNNRKSHISTNDKKGAFLLNSNFVLMFEGWYHVSQTSEITAKLNFHRFNICWYVLHQVLRC